MADTRRTKNRIKSSGSQQGSRRSSKTSSEVKSSKVEAQNTRRKMTAEQKQAAKRQAVKNQAVKNRVQGNSNTSKKVKAQANAVAAPRPVGRIDWVFVATMGLLIIFGLFMLYSASSYNSQLKFDTATWYVRKQAIATAVGLVAMLVCMFIPYSFWKKLGAVIYIASLFLLMLVRTSIGIEANGAKRWIDLKVMTFQPSEAVKLAVIIFTSALIYKFYKSLDDFKVYIGIAAVCIIGGGLVAVVTDDLGTAIIIVAIGLVELLITTPKLRYIAATVGAGIVAVVALIVAEPYRMVRVKAWLDVEAYASDESYQVIQGLYAIGSGGFFGKGIGKSTQKLGFVPESQNDLIFSIICEELGIIGALVLIALFVVLIWRLWKMYKNTDELFGKLIIAGAATHIAAQTIVNMAVVTSLIPNTGIPLPFISYGGSSIIMTLAEMGIVLAVCRKCETKADLFRFRKKRKKKQEGVIYLDGTASR